jgi:ABC-2 type transport system ATP-binding protein
VPPSSPPAALEIRSLTKRFGDVTAVDDLSFTVAPGEVFGLLGPNGAGKTTTIQLLLGLTTPTSGHIRVLGLSMPEDRLAILARVNFSSAYISLPSNLTVRQNLRVFAGLYGVRSSRDKIDALLELFEVTGSADKATGALSSGQLTRVNLCKAFLNDPEVLFLDEPTASLDPDIADKVRTALQKLQRERGVTIVYTSHNMREVEVLCDRVLFLARGHSVAEGSPRDVIAHAKSASLEDVFIAIARDGDLTDPAGREDPGR